MDAKQYLEQLEVIDMCILQDMERLAEMKLNATGVVGIDYSRNRVQTSLTGDKLCSDVTRYIALNDDINAKVDTFVDIKNKIIQQIRSLRNKKHIAVLYKIYVQYKSILEVAYEMKISYGYAKKLHSQALARFDSVCRSQKEPFVYYLGTK